MQSEILALMNKTEEDDILGNIIYNLMTNCYQPYSEILGFEEETEYRWFIFKIKKKITRKGMPLPLVFKLLSIMNKENKKMEKEMRRKK